MSKFPVGTMALFLALFLGAAAFGDEPATTEPNPTQSQTQTKSCLSLCVQDGGDVDTCTDYCTMVVLAPTLPADPTAAIANGPTIIIEKAFLP